MIKVKLNDTYDAWKYTGGEDIPEEVDRWMSHYGLKYVSVERDKFYLDSLLKVQEIMNFNFSASVRTPSEHLEWSVEDATFRCFPGEFIVDTEIGPCPFEAELVEIVQS